MNWLKKTLRFGEKIKQLLKKRPSKSDIENSDWTSCCKGPVLKKDLEENLWVCNACGKHHRINCIQRFDIIFGKNNYEVLKTPIPADDPLEFEDSSPYIKKLNSLRNIYLYRLNRQQIKLEFKKLFKLGSNDLIKPMNINGNVKVFGIIKCFKSIKKFEPKIKCLELAQASKKLDFSSQASQNMWLTSLNSSRA